MENSCYSWVSQVAQWVKNLPTMQEMWVQILNWDDPLEKEMATYSNILAWKIPWTEEPGGLQCTWLKRIRCNWNDWASAAAKCLTLCDPMDGSTPGSPVPGILQEEHWSGLPFPSPNHESEKWKWSRSVMYMTPSDSMDCGLPGSSVHGIFQARVLEWVAIQAHIYTKNTCVWYSYLPISIHWQILGTWRVHFPLQSGLQLSGPQKNVSTLYKNDPRFLQSVSSPHEYPGCLRETSLCFPHLRKLNVWNAQLSIFLSWKSKLSQRDDSQVSQCAPTLWPTILVLSEGL